MGRGGDGKPAGAPVPHLDYARRHSADRPNVQLESILTANENKTRKIFAKNSIAFRTLIEQLGQSNGNEKYAPMILIEHVKRLFPPSSAYKVEQHSTALNTDRFSQ